MHGNDGISNKDDFQNLTGKNFQGREYADYIRHIAIGSMGFTPGSIEFCRDGDVIDTGTIPECMKSGKSDEVGGFIGFSFTVTGYTAVQTPPFSV